MQNILPYFKWMNSLINVFIDSSKAQELFNGQTEYEDSAQPIMLLAAFGSAFVISIIYYLIINRMLKMTCGQDKDWRLSLLLNFIVSIGLIVYFAFEYIPTPEPGTAIFGKFLNNFLGLQVGFLSLYGIMSSIFYMIFSLIFMRLSNHAKYTPLFLSNILKSFSIK